MKQRLLIVGPLGDYGGRELETGFIAETLSKDFEIRIFSTGNLTSDSQIFDFVSKVQVETLNETLFKSNLWLRLLSYLSYLKSGKKQSVLNYVSNQFAKKTGYRSSAITHLKNAIDNCDLIMLCVQISSNYVREIVEYANDTNKPVVLRTSNTIKKIDIKNNSWLNNISLYIHHSLSNADRLSSLQNHNYTIIDQCTFKEEELLKIKPAERLKSLLYVGRLSPEKGIKELVDVFLNNTNDLSLKIIGDGELYKDLIRLTDETNSIQLLGYLDQNEIVEHIKNADAVIIPSHEESGPLVGLEAMASARLVISTRVGAMPYRLKDALHQFWFNVNCMDSLDDIINKIQNLNSEEINVIALENRAIYVANYKQTVIESQYKKAIFSLIKK